MPQYQQQPQKVQEAQSHRGYKGDKVLIHCDGGCRSKDRQMYGSYEILHAHSFTTSPRLIEIRLKARLGIGGTCNQAEFLIMIKAIRRTLELLDMAGLEPNLFSMSIKTDSMIVVWAIDHGSPKTGNQLLAALGKEAQQLLTRFRSSDVSWVGREQMVARFGH